MWVIDTGVTAAALEHTRAGSSVYGVDAIVESSRISAETASLATLLRGDRLMRALAREGDVISVRTLSPNGPVALAAVVAQIAHRVPG